MIICPLCHQHVEYKHVLEDHKEFWDLKLPTEQLPQTVEDFNKRFGPIGLGIEEIK